MAMNMLPAESSIMTPNVKPNFSFNVSLMSPVSDLGQSIAFRIVRGIGMSALE